jgi:mannose-6-phosphate isomerase-like protein (cupin superfamily)
MYTKVISSAKLDIALQCPDLKLMEKHTAWLPHFNKVHYSGTWDVLPLRSVSGNKDSLFAETMNKGRFEDTDHLSAFPEIKKLLNSLNCPLLSARLLNLKAGSAIKKHRDFELSFENGEARLHFPIVTNKRVSFCLNDEFIEMKPGECWYINANLPHHAINEGHTDRIHLVIDCVVNDWLKDLFEKAKKSYYTQQPDIEQIKAMIMELKRKPTPGADKIVVELENKYKHLI